MSITEWIKKNDHINSHYIHSLANQGKTAAIKQGLEQAKGEYTIIQDGDLEYNFLDIPVLLKYIEEQKVDYVMGVRKSKFQTLNPHDIILKLGVIILAWLFNLLYKTDFKDLSGGYKIFKTEKLKTIHFTEEGFTFCYEVSIKFLQKKYSIAQFPIDYNSRRKNDGKKITFADGFKCLGVILKYRSLRATILK